MPKLGLTMEAGTISAWLVPSGTEVEQGTPVLTIETDKVESDVEASASGVLHITGAEGDVFECGERIGWFLEPGEAPPQEPAREPAPGQAGRAAAARPTEGARAPGTASQVAPRPAGGRLLASPNARRVAAQRGVDLNRVVGSGPGGRIVSEDVLAAPAGPGGGSVPPATHAARQTAERLGVDLAEVAPGSPGSPIDRADVERHVRRRLHEGVATTATPEVPLSQEPSSRIPLRGVRGRIAQRMHASLRDMAQLTLHTDVVMDAVVAHRSAADPQARAGFTDYVLAATAAALREHPLVNSQVAGDAVNLLPRVHLGMAVALDDGLVVPVVRDADRLTLEELSAETTRLAAAAREGTLTLDDVEGGTFSVTALGMYGVDSFTPVINPPNTAILGVGRLRDSVAWIDGVATPTRVLTLSLTWDHRAYDGAPAAEFASAVRDRLENWGPA